VGGTWGYEEFLEAMAYPDHEGILEWACGSYDTEMFDPAAATKVMRRELPDLRFSNNNQNAISKTISG
jgi:hypothetical protein